MKPTFIAPPTIQEIVINEVISWEEAVSIGMELRLAKDNSQWDLGDLASKVETVYGTDAIGKLANDIGLNKKSMMQYRRVSQAFPPNQRLDILSHRHHMILAPREDRLEWLQQAADNSWSTMQLTRELALADGKEVKDEEASPEVHRCTTCHQWKLDTDQVCHCYKFRS